MKISSTLTGTLLRISVICVNIHGLALGGRCSVTEFELRGYIWNAVLVLQLRVIRAA